MDNDGDYNDDNEDKLAGDRGENRKESGGKENNDVGTRLHTVHRPQR